MQKSKLASLMLIMVATIAITPTLGLAYAQDASTTDNTNPSDTQVQQALADSISAGLVIGGAGAASGALLSFVRVAGKNLGNPSKKEPLVISKLVLTMAVGFGIGMVGHYLNVPDVATLAGNGFVLYLITQLVFPVFGNRVWKTK